MTGRRLTRVLQRGFKDQIKPLHNQTKRATRGDGLRDNGGQRGGGGVCWRVADHCGDKLAASRRRGGSGGNLPGREQDVLVLSHVMWLSLVHSHRGCRRHLPCVRCGEGRRRLRGRQPHIGADRRRCLLAVVVASLCGRALCRYDVLQRVAQSCSSAREKEKTREREREKTREREREKERKREREREAASLVLLDPSPLHCDSQCRRKPGHRHVDFRFPLERGGEQGVY